MVIQMTLLASFWSGLGSAAMVMVALLLIGLILLQKNRGAGLSGAFGGVGGHTAFGTKTGDFLTWVTVGLAALFLLLAIVLNFAFEPTSLAGANPPVQSASVPAPPPADPTGGTPSGSSSPVPASDAPTGG